MVEPTRPLRLLSYNIRSLRDDAAAVARVVRAAQPDVVCVQEAPRFWRWRAKAAALARHCGLVVVGGGRPCGANLLLSTLAVEVDTVAELAFSRDPELHHRGAALAVLRYGGRPFAVAGMHLDLVEGPRLRHLAELRVELERRVPAGVPWIVAGDSNATPDSPTWSALTTLGADAFAAAGRGDGRTFSTADPRRRIDGVFLGAPLRAVCATVLDSSDVRVASDHRPLLVEVDLGRNRADGTAASR
jgi:endonuclease/exonuclease/phosphatase family metal-dependent hydrolase